ncbi:MAG: tetratricopeptide repeat protein [Armatimonadetes bacterium]|nr:tetratricopeptide repeat protein [Armatimonadota bacterium]
MTLPMGTVTFLFADIEESTRLLQHLGDRYADVLAAYRRLFRSAFQAYAGREVDTQGDAFFVAFPSAKGAVSAALSATRSVLAHPWPEGVSMRVRMGLHTGEASSGEAGYIGMDVHRAARISAAGHGGQILLSEATRLLIQDDLPRDVALRDLGEHRLKDITSPIRLYQVVTADLPSDFPPLQLLDVPPHNLPVQLTSFIGREVEMAEVKRLLQTARLLTLTGTGGCGKTRLALHVAADLLEAFGDGVWSVELAPIMDPALVVQTVASALYVREEAGRPLLDTLSDAVRGRSVLVVLDNCEHLVSACATLTHALLVAGTTLRILATSRERLGVAGEVSYAVPSLSVPDVRRPASLEDLRRSEAVRLFVERAAMSRRGFQLTEENATAVAEICEALDGIPLAIELAAARVKVLSAEQIAERLEDRFRLLAGGSRTVLPRQQTLQATMDWSFDLLAEKERVLLRRLSVFAGGFTLDSVEAVCAGDGISQDEVLNVLAHLVDKSLVLVDQQPATPRYRLLDTVRHYALEKLQQSGEAERARIRHRDLCVALAERAEPELAGRQEVWLNRLETEHDNLRAALKHSLRSEDAEAALRLGGALWRFWQVRGYWSEGRQWLEAALAASGRAPAALRGKVMTGAGVLAQQQGDYEQAKALSEGGMTLQQELGDEQGMAVSLSTLGNVAYHRGDYTAAQQLHEESLSYGRAVGNVHSVAASLVNLAILADHQGTYEKAAALCRESLHLFREADDKRGSGFVLNMLGILASDQGDYTAARPLFEESLGIRRELGDRRGIAASVNNLGLVAREQGDYAAAQALYEESLAIRRELGDKQGIAASLSNLGLIAWWQGDRARARTLCQEGLKLLQALGDKAGIAGSLEGLAMIEPDPERAARLYGAAEGLRDVLHHPRPPSGRSDYDRQVGALRAALDEQAFAVAWAQGRAMPLEQAIPYALSGGGA